MGKARATAQRDDRPLVGGMRLTPEKLAELEKAVQPMAAAAAKGDRSWIENPPRAHVRSDSRIKVFDEDIDDVRLAVKNGWTIQGVWAIYKGMGREIGYSTLRAIVAGRLKKRGIKRPEELSGPPQKP